MIRFTSFRESWSMCLLTIGEKEIIILSLPSQNKNKLLGLLECKHEDISPIVYFLIHMYRVLC